MKWIKTNWRGRSKSGKTDIYYVYAKDTSYLLGHIGWFAPWRKYCFTPDNATVYEQDCLRDIAKFIQEKTEQHRQHREQLKRQKEQS